MPVNDAVTDSLTQVNTKVLGDVPAMATGNLFVATSQALANSAHNMTNTVQQNQLVGNATTVQGVNALFSKGAAIIARTSDQILTRD
ncbi:conserved hypothetical protein [Vibrio chagasii]|nr:conserved hypothetical protein [Vibrio chagasii]